MRRIIFSAVLIWVAGFTPAHAQAPNTFTYQGLLTNPDGTPVEDNAYVFEFRLYTVATGGSPVAACILVLTTQNGVYNATLCTDNPLPEGIFDQSLWLAVRVGSDPEMTPRTPLSSVPYAHGLHLPVEATGDATTQTLKITNTNAAGYAGYFAGGRGLYVAQDDLGGIPESAFHADDLYVTSADAVTGLYSDHIGGWGSALVLAETNAGNLVNKWAMARRTTGGGGGLRFTYGSNANYASNPTLMTLLPNGGMAIGVNATPPAGGLLVQGDIQLNQPQTRWFSIPAQGFTAHDSGSHESGSLSLGGRGALICQVVTDDGCYNTAAVYLPHGATITALRALIRDNSDNTGANVSIELRRKSHTTGGENVLANILSAGDPGDEVVYTDTSINNSVVDNENYAYYLRSNMPEFDLAIYTVRIAYTVTSVLP